MSQEGLNGHFVLLTTPCEFCWRKSALESCWSPEFTGSSSPTCTCHLIWLHPLGGFTPQISSTGTFCACGSVPVDQHRGAQPTKNTFSGESGCLGKNVTEIPCWIISLSSDGLCYFCRAPSAWPGGRAAALRKVRVSRAARLSEAGAAAPAAPSATPASGGWAFPLLPPGRGGANFNVVRRRRDVIARWSQLFILGRRAALLFGEGRQELQFHCAGWGSGEKRVKLLLDSSFVLQKCFQRLSLSPPPCELYLVLSSLGCCIDSSLPFPVQLIRAGLIVLLSVIV